MIELETDAACVKNLIKSLGPEGMAALLAHFARTAKAETEKKAAGEAAQEAANDINNTNIDR